MFMETSIRKEVLACKFQEVRFAQALSLQTQQEVQHWEQQQREAFTNRLRMVEHRQWQEIFQQNHAVEVTPIDRSESLCSMGF